MVDGDVVQARCDHEPGLNCGLNDFPEPLIHIESVARGCQIAQACFSCATLCCSRVFDSRSGCCKDGCKPRIIKMGEAQILLRDTMFLVAREGIEPPTH